MTAPLIAPLIPPRGRLAPEVATVPADVLRGFGRMDSSGRVADRAMTSALAGNPGTG